METTFDASRIHGWFTSGSASAGITEALSLVRKSAAQNYWVPKASRRVRAIINKSNVAAKLARAHSKELDELKDYSEGNVFSGWDVSFLLLFGHLSYSNSTRTVNFERVRQKAIDAGKTELAKVVVLAQIFYQDMKPLWETCAALDACRPIPVVTYLKASPTVTALLESVGVSASYPTTFKLAPHHFEWMTVTLKNGSKAEVPVIVYDWPKGTAHGLSRYGGTEYHDQCEACGHAIKNPWNWVPVLIEDVASAVNVGDTKPRSLWVGRDCARTIFGIKIDGVVVEKGVDEDPEVVA